MFVQGIPEIIPLLGGSGVGYPTADAAPATLEAFPNRTFAPTRDAAVSARHQEFISERRGRRYSYWSTPRMFLPSSMSA